MADDPDKLADIECGNYGEDGLYAWRRSGAAVELELKSYKGTGQRWTIDASSKLRVTSKAWGHGAMLGIESNLELDGTVIVHFEFDFVSGGVHDEDVAKFVKAIAEYTRCTLDIQPLQMPE